MLGTHSANLLSLKITGTIGVILQWATPPQMHTAPWDKCAHLSGHIEGIRQYDLSDTGQIR